VSIAVPLTADVVAVIDALKADVAGERDSEVYLGSLADTATVVVRAAAPTEHAAEALEHELRLRAHRRLRELGVWELVTPPS